MKAVNTAQVGSAYDSDFRHGMNFLYGNVRRDSIQGDRLEDILSIHY